MGVAEVGAYSPKMYGLYKYILYKKICTVRAYDGTLIRPPKMHHITDVMSIFQSLLEYVKLSSLSFYFIQVSYQRACVCVCAWMLTDGEEREPERTRASLMNINKFLSPATRLTHFWTERDEKDWAVGWFPIWICVCVCVERKSMGGMTAEGVWQKNGAGHFVLYENAKWDG